MKSTEALPKLKSWLGKQIKDVLEDSGTIIKVDSKDKGIGGNFLELGLGLPKNTRPEPDFEDGVELKKVSVRLNRRSKKLTVKEPVKITSLNTSDIASQEFFESHAFGKTRKIIFVPTLYIGTYRQLDEVVLPLIQWEVDDYFDEIFSKDFASISKAVRSGSNLTSSVGVLGSHLIPKTNGQKGDTEKRAIYFSKPAMTEIIGSDYLSSKFELAQRYFQEVV
jgi:DNA mismatch repair protein MutH